MIAVCHQIQKFPVFGLDQAALGRGNHEFIARPQRAQLSDDLPADFRLHGRDHQILSPVMNMRPVFRDIADLIRHVPEHVAHAGKLPSARGAEQHAPGRKSADLLLHLRIEIRCGLLDQSPVNIRCDQPDHVSCPPVSSRQAAPEGSVTCGMFSRGMSRSESSSPGFPITASA